MTLLPVETSDTDDAVGGGCDGSWDDDDSDNDDGSGCVGGGDVGDN